jgi:hypothetical protein
VKRKAKFCSPTDLFCNIVILIYQTGFSAVAAIKSRCLSQINAEHDVSVSVLKKKPEFLEKFAAPSIFEYY